MSLEQAQAIWTDAHGRGRNRYSLFRKSFRVDTAPQTALLHIFADTRYRLLVNGQTVAHGPARFFPGWPEYDTHDITGLLRVGKNVIAVMVNSYGTNCFHADVSSGGLLLAAEISAAGRTQQLVTDGSWKALVSPGHVPETPALSFALNPGELFDARRMPDGWDTPAFDDAAWPAAALRPRDTWGTLRPRSIPLLDERYRTPRRRCGAFLGRYAADETVESLIVASDEHAVHGGRERAVVLAYLHSPRAQDVVLGAWWGKYYLNGQAVSGTRDARAPQRMDYAVHLHEGWNQLQVVEAFGHGWWDFYLGLPRSAGLQLRGAPALDSPDTFLVAGPWSGSRGEEAEKLPWPLADAVALPAKFGPWRHWPRGASAQTPCKDRGWRVWERLDSGGDQRDLAFDVAAVAQRVGDDTLSLLYDFGEEILGRPVLEFSAAAGTVVDVTYNERLTPEGTADVAYRTFVDIADRTIARGGPQTWQTFHPRGMRYLEVLVRGDLSAFDLKRIGVTRAHYPIEDIGSFACSDPTLSDVWQLCARTQHACAEDAYLDCPHRERGLYSGDFLVQFFAHQALQADTRLFRRCIELFFQAQGDNGLVPACPHGLPAGRHPDYSAVLVQCVYKYWARSGDLELVRQQKDRLATLLRGLERLEVPGSGLLDGTSLHPYIDLAHLDKRGVNCALNCFYVQAFADGAKLFELVGDEPRAAHYRARAAALARATREAFWNDEQGVFVDRLVSEVPDTGPSVPANALAILYGVADEVQTRRAGAWLTGAMHHNFRVAEPRHNTDCNVTSYFAYFALEALYRLGYVHQAEAFMRAYWGRMLEHGAWTCWEYLVENAGMSYCHAWSAAPAHYLSTELLGVRFVEPVNPDKIALRPVAGSLHWAEGVYPHPRGPIHVRWEKSADGLRLEYHVPAGVTVVGDGAQTAG